MPFSESSKLLTAVLTLIYVYMFKVLAMGISCSGDLFESINVSLSRTKWSGQHSLWHTGI